MLSFCIQNAKNKNAYLNGKIQNRLFLLDFINNLGVKRLFRMNFSLFLSKSCDEIFKTRKRNLKTSACFFVNESIYIK